ncbi:hypothetical protein EAH87_04500 [Sphingomonas koreensis]|nr:hypothetical protein EAH87_04500 [Sphingomonas koreensis]
MVAAVASAALIAGSQPALARDPGVVPAQAQPLKNGWPVGRGLDALLQDCSGCHSPALVKNESHDAQGWDNLIGMMIGRGAQVSDADQDAIRDYLAHNFGPKAPGAK